MKNQILFILSALLLLLSSVGYSQGCMEAGDDEGVRIIGYLQPQAEYSFLGDDIYGERLDKSDFYFNRLRLGVMGSIPYDFSYYAVTELSPTKGDPHILDAFISYNRFKPYLKVSFGQFKSPFGRELNTPCHKLTTINRSDVVNQLSGPFRDFGLMLTGSTGDLKFLGLKTEHIIGYSIAFMNGTGLNTSDDNRKKDFIGRLTFHPFEFITLGASYRTGKHPALLDDVEDDERSRFGFDMELEYKGFNFQGEFIDGSDKGSYTVGGGCGDPLEVIQGSVDRAGYFAQLMYMTPWKLQPVFRIEQFDPNTSDEEIGANDKQNIMTYGVNYFFNEWTRLQINYLYKAEENASVEVPNDALLMQLQVVF